MMSFEECQEWGKRRREERELLNRKIEQIHQEELRKIGINPNTQEHIQPKIDLVYSLENGGATVLWLIVAIGALIFNGGWILSIIATGVWFNYITRHMEIDNKNGGKNNE